MAIGRRNQDQYMLRLPDGLRDEIKAAADANNRSMNSEIIARLSGDVETLRDKFAGQALVGLYACGDLQMATLHDLGRVGVGPFEEIMSRQAYKQADAMLAARKGGE
ncbi:Arc family DNA-binding protein [Sinorhizobium meliloti]|uniref:Arc family DNA-binding protein n=1 Tax=Rhizobium meliloti TaxID=382 RepID=UPI0002861512|nr:Arc family DNA-binding protein [Sinorhizobium meliloti]ASP79628.1 Arc family DNA-binding protein [Sinorhizobium meliloti]MQW17350.1 Arc family DNA-binding protein [Sinorhizobium meliloti]CCM66769.1 hypothetical protein BN406_00724 [Sinorhizobium meliloti Rm41]